MRAVVQRVDRASVLVEGEEVARIGAGLCCLVGVESGDGGEDVDLMARRLVGLRIFDDDQGRMNHDIARIRGEILLVSQFTLLGDCRRGKRPSYTQAEEPKRAQALFDELAQKVRELHEGKVVTGRFQTTMEVSLINHGPVTLLIDSRRRF